MHHVSSPSLVTRLGRALAPLALPTLVLCTTALAGCSDADDDSVGTPTITATPPIKIEQENNYTAMTELGKPQPATVISTAAGTDLKIDWTAFQTDIQGHTVDSTNPVKEVAFVDILADSTDAALTRLAANEINSTDDHEFEFVIDPTEMPPPTTAQLKTFKLGSAAINLASDYAIQSGHQYIIELQNTTTIGVGALGFVFLDPKSPDIETNTTVTFPGDLSGQLTFTPKMGTPVSVPKAGPWLMNWKDVKTGSDSNRIDPTGIDSLLLGYYADIHSVDDLQVQKTFLDLKQPDAPTKSWEITLTGGTSADLADATDRKDKTTKFTGFDVTDGTWVMGLFCSSCQNPAPPIVVVLAPQ